MKKTLFECIDLFIEGDKSALIKIRSLILKEITEDSSEEEYNSFCYEIHDEDSYVVENQSEEDIKDGLRSLNDFRTWFAERKLVRIHFWVESDLVTSDNIKEVRLNLLQICKKNFDDIIIFRSNLPKSKSFLQKVFNK